MTDHSRHQYRQDATDRQDQRTRIPGARSESVATAGDGPMAGLTGAGILFTARPEVCVQAESP